MLWWVETRPEEDGRSAVVRCALDGEATEVLGDELATLGAQHDLRSWLPVGGRAAVVAHEDGLHADTGTLVPLDLPYTAYQPRLRTCGTVIAGVAGAPTRGPPPSWRSMPAPDRTGCFAGRCKPQRVAGLPQRSGPPSPDATATECTRSFLPPHNPDVRAPARERAPCVLFLRDWPVDRASRMLDPVIPFFTSRGAGAGGATALGVLAHTNLCAGGTVYAGIVDLSLLAGQGTRWVAEPLRALAADSALQRDPSWLRSIRRPVLMFHGTRDEVVPPAQSRLLDEALRRNGVPRARLVFPGEGHHFRRTDSISRALDAEMAFYGQILGFTPADGSALVLHPT